MWSYFKLEAKVRLKSPEMVFPFFFPFVLTILLSTGFSSNEDVTRAFGALIALSVMQSGLFGFGFSLIDAKDSVIIKRVGSTKITKFEMIMALFMFSALMLSITLLWQTILFAIFSIDGMGLFGGYGVLWGQISWGGFIVGVIIGAILSLSIGMFFVSISKNQNQFSSYVFLYFFAATFLGGMLFPNSGIPWTRYVGYVIPSVWNANMIMGSTLGGNVFNFTNGYGASVTIGADVVQGWEAAYNLFMPILLIGLLLYANNKLFKLD